MNQRNKFLYRAVEWANGLVRKYRKSWSGLTLLVVAEDSARPPKSHRVNYLIILFFVGIMIVLPAAAAWSVVSTNLSGNHGAAMTGRVRLLREIALVNQEREDLFEKVRARNETYRQVARRYQAPAPDRFLAEDSGNQIRNSYISMRLESKKMRRFRRRITRLIQANRRATGFLEHRMLIYHRTPRGLPLHPDDCMYIGKYGWRTDPETGTKSEFHTGVDLIAARGKEIMATAPGEVIEVRNDGDTGYGLFVRIHHGLGITSLYAHTSENLVKEGDSVRRGQVIALVGDTGRTVGAHLHYEIKLGPDYAPDTWRKRKADDPTEYLKNARGEHTCKI